MWTEIKRVNGPRPREPQEDYGRVEGYSGKYGWLNGARD